MAQRRMISERLTQWIHEQICDERNDVEFSVDQGMHLAFGDDLENARPRPNGSATLTVRINGGARNTEGFTDDVGRDAA